MGFSEKLKELRSEKGITQTKLAEDIHISRSAVAKWENGLGLPNDESVKLLAEYFNITVNELAPDKADEKEPFTKKHCTKKSKKAVIALALGIGIPSFILLCMYIDELRDVMTLLIFGAMLIILGVFNMKGNIATVHWYNRRKVTKENQKAYCLFVGLGTLIVGAAMLVAGFVQLLFSVEVSAWINLAGIAVGISLIIYAQIKYNKGIF